MPTNPTTGPDETICDRLDSQLAALTKGTNLFFGPELPIKTGVPHLVVFCLSTGGPPPSGYYNEAKVDRRFTVQIITRSNVDARAAALTVARDCWAAIEQWVPSTGGYYNAVVREADPVYLGLDKTEHHRWVNNCELWYKG